jgi:hypothetical protein
LLEATSRSSVACCGGSGPELSPLRTLVICPASGDFVFIEDSPVYNLYLS